MRIGFKIIHFLILSGIVLILFFEFNWLLFLFIVAGIMSELFSYRARKMEPTMNTVLNDIEEGLVVKQETIGEAYESLIILIDKSENFLKLLVKQKTNLNIGLGFEALQNFLIFSWLFMNAKLDYVIILLLMFCLLMFVSCINECYRNLIDIDNQKTRVKEAEMSLIEIKKSGLNPNQKII